MSAKLQLRALKVPERVVHQLSNGLTVHVIRRGSLPLVAVRLVIRAGSAFDRPGQLGVADFASRLLRRGADGKSANEISESVEFVGASVGGSANEENVIVSLSTPAKHLESMLQIFSRLIQAPDFKDDEIELARRRALASLKNELDDPGVLADRSLLRAIWGAHPYGHESVGGAKDVASFTRDQLVEFHQERLGPHVANLYLVGDVHPDSAIETIDRYFGEWKRGPQFAPVAPPWVGIAKPGEVIIVDKPEQTQVQMRIGAKGVRRGHEDHFSIMLMNTILGGSFTSRLVTEVRVKRGLSYGAGCGFDMMTGAGTFTVSSFTKTEQLETLLDVCLGEVEKMKKKGALPREVETARRYICGLYPSNLETNESVAGAFADVVHYGLSEDWISNYRHRIAAVSVKDVARAAASHLFGEERVVALVGNAEVLKPVASRYGPLTVMAPKDLE